VGANEQARGLLAVHSALLGAALVLPAFAALALAGGPLFSAFALVEDVERLAIEYWEARMLGGPAVVVAWAVAGYWMGRGRMALVLALSGIAFGSNALLNELLVMHANSGLAGSAWATSTGSAAMAATGWVVLRRRQPHREAPTRPSRSSVRPAFALGTPIGPNRRGGRLRHSRPPHRGRAFMGIFSGSLLVGGPAIVTALSSESATIDAARPLLVLAAASGVRRPQPLHWRLAARRR
jgi:hypothetical protein